MKDVFERTGSSDGKRASHALDLLLVNERRVCSVSDVNALALGQEASNVLAAKAVSDGTNLLRALLFHVRQSLLDNRVDLVGKVALALRATLLQPGHDVKVLGAVKLDGVALEEIGHDDEVAVGGELVGDELGVDELMADHVGEDDDGDGGVLGLGVGDVGGDLGVWSGWEIERIWQGGDILPLMVLSSPFASPSCLTPMVQHLPGGLEAIMVVWYGGCDY